MRREDRSSIWKPGQGLVPATQYVFTWTRILVSGIPLGLENTVDVLNAGSGQLTLTLRHLPAESGQAVKTPGLAEQVAADGNFGSIGGANDAQVNFDVTTM